MSKQNKVNIPIYKSCDCLYCPRCKQITELKGFLNLFQNNDRHYIITCDDGFTRDCEVGTARPTNCILDEENYEKWRAEHE